MGHHNPSRQWDLRRRNLFLLTLAWARGADISPRVLHKHLLLRRWATWAKAWVGGKGQDFQAGTLGTQGRVYDVVPQIELADQSYIQGTFPLSQECCLNLDA